MWDKEAERAYDAKLGVESRVDLTVFIPPKSGE
jgi:hypothetical protein